MRVFKAQDWGTERTVGGEMKENKFWYIIPAPVMVSKKISGDEKNLWAVISHNLDNAGCCKLSNAELSKIFDTSPRTISERISNLKQKGYLAITQETRNHSRRLYPKYPGEYEEDLPTEEEKALHIQKLGEACQKGIKLSDFYFKSLFEKLVGSPALSEISAEESDERQFCVTRDQIKFLGNFIDYFPSKRIDVQIASYHLKEDFDVELFMNSILQSDFLLHNANLSLRWLLDNYTRVVSGEFKNIEGKRPYGVSEEEFQKAKGEMSYINI